MARLSNKQHEAFAQTYAQTNHRGLALEAAGYVANTSQHAVALLDREDVQARVAELTGRRLAKAGVTPDRVLRELAAIAFADVRDLYDSDGNLKPIRELDDDAAASIASIDVEVRNAGKGDVPLMVTTRKIKRVDKMAALTLFAKHFKIVGDEGDGVNALASALADRLNSAKKRINATEVEDACIIEPTSLPMPQPAATPQETADEELW